MTMVPRVWAPRADRVGLALFPGEVAMEPRPGGWWAGPVALGHGADYAFRLDDGPPRPDPRSRWQPAGVHGPSRVWDPAGADRPEGARPEGARSDGDWPGREVAGGVVYELHVGTFTAAGTLDAAAERLPHLVALGVDTVELMPVAAFNGRHGWGYDGVGLYAVHEPYGGPGALCRFVDACHRAGLAVVLDVVYNHLGPSGNYLAEFGPYFTDRHRTPWGAAVNLDQDGAAEVRAWIVDNALMWLGDYRLDGLRLDAVHALADSSPRHLLAELSDRVAELAAATGRPRALVAESDRNDARTVTPTAETTPTGPGLGMTCQWDDDAHHAVHALVTGERFGYYVDFGPASVLAHVWRHGFWHDGRHSPFRGRAWGAPVDTARVGGHRLVAFSQDHDQIGNRAGGDRPDPGRDAGGAAVAAALVLTSPFTPMLFMGEEWAAGTPWQYFTDHPEPELAEAVRAGRRAEFARHGWSAEDVPDPQDPATFARSVLDWAEPARGVHARMLAWYRALIALRRTEPELRADDLREVSVRFDADEDTGWLVVGRGRLEVVVGLAAEPVEVPLRARTGEPLAVVRLAWDPAGTVLSEPSGPRPRLRLPARSAAVVGPPAAL